jgi:hypothetical protein
MEEHVNQLAKETPPQEAHDKIREGHNKKHKREKTVATLKSQRYSEAQGMIGEDLELHEIDTILDGVNLQEVLVSCQTQ